MPLTYFTSGYSANSVTQTITHSLSRAPASLRAFVTPKNVAAATGVPFIGEIGTNIITVKGQIDDSLIDLTVIEFHSLQGNG